MRTIYDVKILGVSIGMTFNKAEAHSWLVGRDPRACCVEPRAYKAAA